MPAPLAGLLLRLGASTAGRGAASTAARRTAAGSRLKRLRGKKIAKEFLENAIESVSSGGAGGQAGTTRARTGSGRLLKSLGYSPGSEGFDFHPPRLDNPRRVSPISNPTISSLEKLLKDIAKTAAELGVLTKKQQDELLKEAIRAEAVAEEQQLEQIGATPIGAEGVGDSIGPADSAIEKLIQAISGLQSEIEKKILESEQGQGGGAGGGVDLDFNRSRGGGRGKAPKLRRGFRSVAGGGYQNIKTGRFVTPENALKNFNTVDPRFLSQAAKGRQATAVAAKSSGRATGALGSTVANILGRSSVGVAGGQGRRATSAVGKSSGRVASALGSAVAKSRTGAGAAAKIGKEAIAKIAAPLVAKSLLKTGIKSIPIVGAVAGGLFALGRLLQGDVVGAGLEAASGLAGPLTAIPALVLSLARDVYTGTFGIAPEADPLVGQRMGMVKGVVTELAEEQLGKKVTNTPTGGGGGGTAAPAARAPAIPAAPAAPPAPATPVVTPTATSSAPPPPQTAAAADPASAGGGGGATGGGGGGGTPPTAPPPSPQAGPPSETPQQQAVENTANRLRGEEGGPPPATGPAPEVRSLTGETILRASTDTPSTPAAPGMPGMGPPRPATLPTTKGRAKGMGDVPEPTYLNLGSIARQLYFGSVAGVMAS